MKLKVPASIDVLRSAVRALLFALAVVVIAGCAANRPLRTPDVGLAVQAALAPGPVRPPSVPLQITESLTKPSSPAVSSAQEPKLDLIVTDALARQVFLALVADSQYSLLLHPDVTGKVSMTLRAVTVPEALEAIKDVYGYDYKLEGRRITIYSKAIQTRIFMVNYPYSQRVGNSELRVSQGASLQSSAAGNSTSANSNSGSQTAAPTGRQSAEGSRVSTTSKTDFWAELQSAVQGLVGKEDGRTVVVSPQAGIMAVRAMPDELREVEKFLKAAQVAVERQVMLEAKIVEVELRDGFQSGIDWSVLKIRGSGAGALGVSGGASSNALINGAQPGRPRFSTGADAILTDGISLPPAGTGLFGLTLASNGFQAVLGFLETQGDVQILSSPRIATLNNQKAVLKVGSEDFFVTNVTSGTGSTNTTGVTNSTAIPTLTPFFSGISLDVTPQIDDSSNIMLHVHPSVTSVTEKTKSIGLGSLGSLSLPLASSSVNESDTLVRIQDGNIVAIGGLMQIESNRRSSGLPGVSDLPVFSSLFGNKANTGRKKEVVVLIKPTIIRNAQDWEDQTRLSRQALTDMDQARSRVIRIDGSVHEDKALPPES